MNELHEYKIVLNVFTYDVEEVAKEEAEEIIELLGKNGFTANVERVELFKL